MGFLPISSLSQVNPAATLNSYIILNVEYFFRTIGKLDAWSKVIYPGMKESIVGVMLASQDQVEQRKNCFELYGADFMLSEDLKPWLIEINSCPCKNRNRIVIS